MGWVARVVAAGRPPGPRRRARGAAPHLGQQVALAGLKRALPQQRGDGEPHVARGGAGQQRILPAGPQGRGGGWGVTPGTKWGMGGPPEVSGSGRKLCISPTGQPKGCPHMRQATHHARRLLPQPRALPPACLKKSSSGSACVHASAMTTAIAEVSSSARWYTTPTSLKLRAPYAWLRGVEHFQVRMGVKLRVTCLWLRSAPLCVRTAGALWKTAGLLGSRSAGWREEARRTLPASPWRWRSPSAGSCLRVGWAGPGSGHASGVQAESWRRESACTSVHGSSHPGPRPTLRKNHSAPHSLPQRLVLFRPTPPPCCKAHR